MTVREDASTVKFWSIPSLFLHHACRCWSSCRYPLVRSSGSLIVVCEMSRWLCWDIVRQLIPSSMALVLFYTNFTFSLLIDGKPNEVRYYCKSYYSAEVDSSHIKLSFRAMRIVSEPWFKSVHQGFLSCRGPRPIMRSSNISPKNPRNERCARFNKPGNVTA